MKKLILFAVIFTSCNTVKQFSTDADNRIQKVSNVLGVAGIRLPSTPLDAQAGLSGHVFQNALVQLRYKYLKH